MWHESRGRRTRRVLVSVVAIVMGAAALGAQGAQRLASDPACQSLTLASAGGPMPRNPSTLVVRWLGASSHELSYRNQIVLMNAFYKHVPGDTRPLGFDRDDIKKANAIFIGHGHFDHFGDTPMIAQRTGATVMGGLNVADLAIKMGVPAAKVTGAKGGEVQKFNGFSVQAVLGRHAMLRPGVMDAFTEAFAKTKPLTDEQRRVMKEIGVGTGPKILYRMSSEDELVVEGDFGFLITFDDGFRVMWRDSAGPATDQERALMKRIGSTDLAIVAYQARYFADEQIESTLPLIKLYNPRYYIPDHHDGLIFGQGVRFFDMALYPLYMAMRDEKMATKPITPLYRSAVCFDTKTREMFVGP